MPNIQDSVTCCNKFANEYEKNTGQKYDKAEKIYTKKCVKLEMKKMRLRLRSKKENSVLIWD